jgi:hypothetical protein
MTKKRVWLILSILIGSVPAVSVFAIETAGTLFVDLNANSFSPTNKIWTNPGTLGDFAAFGTPRLTLDPVPAVFFDGQSALVGAELAPAGLVGSNPTRSIEVWAFNPDLLAEETLVSWGKRGGPDGTNMAFNYGNHGRYGAVGHWGGDFADMGWIDNDWTEGAPEAGAWHHLVYTYDGSTASVYSDGVLANSEDMLQYPTADGEMGLKTHGDTRIAIAAQW